MKYLISLLAVVPGAALAHGGHAPMPEGAHMLSHSVPLVALIVLAVGVVAIQWWRS